MKKLFLVSIICIVVLIGCDMNRQSTFYFYSLADLPDSNTDPIDVTISGVWWKATDYTIIMSKGRSPEGYLETQAQEEVDKTTFTLKLNGVEAVPSSSMTIDELDSSWHVVQSFKIRQLKKGSDYLLEGTTVSTGDPSFTRTNVVRLRVR